jgi:transglutaminase-like putative cysteine protease
MSPPKRPATLKETTFYRRQSPFTSPGAWGRWYRDLPSDVPGLCRVVQGLVVHYRSPQIKRLALPRSRLTEISTRYVDKMIARLRELDRRRLTEEREVTNRIVGCCRDFAVLFTSMARSRGIPARVRVGFANYFAAFPSPLWIDHTIAEYWAPEEHRWRLVDPEQTPALVRENRIRFDVTDIPRDRFLVGGLAWQSCRQGKSDANDFGVESKGQPRALWFVRSRLLLDIAALNRIEVLLWDSWTDSSPVARIGAKGVEELDRRAMLSGQQPPPFKEVRTIYRSRRWRVPRAVWVYSPVERPHREVLRIAS